VRQEEIIFFHPQRPLREIQVKGSTYRRCYCRGDDGKPLGKACPQLSSRRHGTYAVRQELPPRADGSRRSFSRSGYESATKAQEALDKVRALLAIPDSDDRDGQVAIGDLLETVSRDKNAALPDFDATQRRYRSGASLTARPTVGEWLDEWLESKKTRRNTTRGYESHIRVHLKPAIGHVRLDRLNVGHLVAMFDAIADRNEAILAENAARREQVARCKHDRRCRPTEAERAALAVERAKLEAMPPFRRTTNAATRQRIRATLRSALNAAIARQMGITFNPAAHLEMDSGRRPKAQLWTPERVEQWERTGEKPCPVMVWTPAQIGAFLDAAAEDRLYALFHVIAYRGLRRGEAVGQEWTNVDLDAGLLTVATELVVDGWDVYESAPKSDAGARVIALDAGTVEALREHRGRQRAEKRKAGAGWVETGKVFTQEDGSWLHPEAVSDRFEQIYRAAGLPPVRLHDLRHGAATLIHAGGGDMHTIKETLGHSGIAISSDTYTSLLPEVDRAVAEAAAALVPRQRTKPQSKIVDTSAHASLTQEAGNEEAPREV
jgi:integrase